MKTRGNHGNHCNGSNGGDGDFDGSDGNCQIDGNGGDGEIDGNDNLTSTGERRSEFTTIFLNTPSPILITLNTLNAMQTFPVLTKT